MQLDSRSSPQDKAFAFLEESDRRLADEAPRVVDWASHALVIAAVADGGSSADGEASEAGVATNTRK